MREEQKESERSWIALLVEKLGLPTNCFTDGNEPPDFEVRLDDLRIAVEVTEVYKSQAGNSELPLQAIESNERVVLELAEKLAVENNVPPQFVSVRIRRDCLSFKHRRGLATAIFRFVQQHAQQSGESKWFNPRELPRFIGSLFMFGHVNTGHRWTGSSCGWVDEAYLEGLQNAISKKEKQRTDYADRYDKTWLVMVATHEGASSFIEWSQPLEDHEFDCQFDRAYFINGSSKSVHAVCIKPRGTLSP